MNRRNTTLAAALALTVGIALAGCSSDSGPELKTSGAFMPQPVNTGMAGGFVTVTNTGDEADKLTSATSDISGEVQLHTTVDNKMHQVKSFDIPANGKLELKRGGNHLMFMMLKQKPVEGDKVTVELHFEKSDPIKLTVPVMAANYNPQK
jgi:hypothetical protein